MFSSIISKISFSFFIFDLCFVKPFARHKCYFAADRQMKQTSQDSDWVVSSVEIEEMFQNS